MSERFSWSDDQHVVVFKSVMGVAVYTNEDADIVIRQADHFGGVDDDGVIIIPRDRVEAVISALKAEIEG